MAWRCAVISAASVDCGSADREHGVQYRRWRRRSLDRDLAIGAEAGAESWRLAPRYHPVVTPSAEIETELPACRSTLRCSSPACGWRWAFRAARTRWRCCARWRREARSWAWCSTPRTCTTACAARRPMAIWNFCRELAAKLGLPFHEARVDTADCGEGRSQARASRRDHRGSCAAAALRVVSELAGLGRGRRSGDGAHARRPGRDGAGQVSARSVDGGPGRNLSKT